MRGTEENAGGAVWGTEHDVARGGRGLRGGSAAADAATTRIVRLKMKRSGVEHL